MRSTTRIVALLAAGLASAASAQDLAVIGIDAPRGGCALGSGETVSVRVFNYGMTLPAGSTFDVAYSINAGTPVVEPVVLASALLRNSTLSYVFAAPADLAVPGTYVLRATVALDGDVNPANDAPAPVDVGNSAPSVGGSSSGPSGPVFAGAVSVSGELGDVLEWQQSEDGGRRWRRIAEPAATLAFDQLRKDTLFRALVGNGGCAPAPSSPVLVTSSDPIFYSGFES